MWSDYSSYTHVDESILFKVVDHKSIDCHRSFWDYHRPSFVGPLEISQIVRLAKNTEACRFFDMRGLSESVKY